MRYCVVRTFSELRPVSITGDPVTCVECLDTPTAEDGRMLVLAMFHNGEMTDLKCAKCRGHINNAQEIIKELSWQTIRSQA